MEMMDVTRCNRTVGISQNLRQELLPTWADMGTTCIAEHVDSDTSSDGEFVLCASQQENEEHVLSESQSSRDLSSDELEDCMQRVCGTVMKYPIDSGRWFGMAKDRYFAVVFPMSWYCGGAERLALSCKLQYRVKLQEPSLCFWANEEMSATSEPLGYLPIASVVGVSHDIDEDQGLFVKISAVAISRGTSTAEN